MNNNDNTFIFSIVCFHAIQDNKIKSLDYVFNTIYNQYIPQMEPFSFKEYIEPIYNDVKSHYLSLNYECA